MHACHQDQEKVSRSRNVYHYIQWHWDREEKGLAYRKDMYYSSVESTQILLVDKERYVPTIKKPSVK